MNDPNLVLHSFDLKDAARVYRAIDHPLRQSILRLLHKHSFMNVSDLYHHLKIEQSVASQHLGILRSARLVSVQRKSRFVFYSVNYERLQQVHDKAAELNRIIKDK